MIKAQNLIKYLILASLAYLFLLIIKPFLASIIFAIVFAIIFSPFYNLLQKKFKWNKSVSAVVILIITVIFILAPLITFFGLVAKQAIIFASTFDQQEVFHFLDKYSDYSIFGYKLDLQSLENQIQGLLTSAANSIYVIAKSVGAGIANFTFLFFVFLFLYFYFLRDGENLINKIKTLLPFQEKQNKVLFEKFKLISKTVFVAHLSVALASGILAYIGFSIFGVGAPLIWALLAGILSLIPTIGTFIVYILGISIAGFLSGYPFAIGFFAYYMVFEIGLIENYIKPKLLDEKFSVHPILVFFALVGGVNAFGSIGILYGPLIVVLLFTILDFTLETKKS